MGRIFPPFQPSGPSSLVKVETSFVRSAARASDLPRDGLSEIAFAGRSNVGKSSLINALVRQRIARTSAAPGKTRLANIYRVVRGSGPPIYVVDLPGYGYARGGGAEFEDLIAAYFDRLPPDWRPLCVVLLVDARHQALEIDLDAWKWLRTTVDDAAIVATKIDKLARGQRSRAVRELESAFEHSVLPVSAVTAEGLDELWKLIDQLANNSSSLKRPRNSRRNSRPRATAPRPPSE